MIAYSKYAFLVIVPSDGSSTEERDRVHDAFDTFLKDTALGDITKCNYDYSNGNGVIVAVLNNKSALRQAREFIASLNSPGAKAQWETIPGSGRPPAGEPDFPGITRVPS